MGQTLEALIAGAIEWAEAGVPVFPCGGNKTPLTEEGFYDATTDPVKIRAIFEMFGDATKMVGARMGAESGLFTMDFDLYKGDEPKNFMERLIREGALPDSRCHKTKSEGLHVIYRSSTKWPNVKPCAGVEVKGEGGYIIVPPTPGYEVITEGVVEAPPSLFDILDHARDVSSAASIDQLRMAVIDASDFHDSLRGIAARLSADGEPPEKVLRYLIDLLEGSAARNENHKRHGRWKKLISDDSKELSRIVKSGYEKYNPQAKVNGFRESYNDTWEQTARDAGFTDAPVSPDGGFVEPKFEGTENPFEGQGTWVHDSHNILERIPVAYPFAMENEVSINSAHPKQGKTAFEVALGLHIAMGRDFGESIVIPKPRAVLYLALEGAAAIEQRIEAFKQEYEITEKVPMFVYTRPANLAQPEVKQTLLAQIKQFNVHCEAEYGVTLGCVTIDTLTKAMAGADQNSVEDTSAVFEMHDLIRAQPELNTHVRYVHHLSKEGKTRGSSNIEAEVDMGLRTEIKDGIIYVKVDISRSVEAGGSYAFITKQVNLGKDTLGVDVTSFVVEAHEAEEPSGTHIEEAQKQAKAKDVILSMGEGKHRLKTVLELVGAAGVGPVGADGKPISPARGKGVAAQEWIMSLIGLGGAVYKNHALSLEVVGANVAVYVIVKAL